MPLIQCITRVQFDFGALALLQEECDRIGVRCPLVVTDAGIRAAGHDGIIAVGGGSSIDLAKGVAVLAIHEGPLRSFAAVEGGVACARWASARNCIPASWPARWPTTATRPTRATPAPTTTAGCWRRACKARQRARHEQTPTAERRRHPWA